MTSMSPSISVWPQTPPLPPVNEPVLIRAATSPARPVARQELRKVLRQVLVGWSGIPATHLPLAESSRGPCWDGLLDGHGLDISLSYAEDEGWIAVVRGACIGVDAMKLKSVPDAETVARNYFHPGFAAKLQGAVEPTRIFAEAWTELEARIKCRRHGLTEWSPASDQALDQSTRCSKLAWEGTQLAVATSSPYMLRTVPDDGANAPKENFRAPGSRPCGGQWLSVTSQSPAP